MAEDSDSDHADQLDEQLDHMYEDYKEAARLREATARAKQMRRLSKHKRLVLQQEQEEMIEDERRAHEQAQRELADNKLRFGAKSAGSGKRKKRRKRSDGSSSVESDSSSDDLDSDEQRRLDQLATVPATKRAALWYDQDLFEGVEDDASVGGVGGGGGESANGGDGASALDLADARRKKRALVGDDSDNTGSSDSDSDSDSLADDFEAKLKRDSLRDIRAGKDEGGDESSSSDDERKVERKPKTRREREREEKRQAILGKKDADKDTGMFEIVPLEESASDTDSDKGGQDAQMEALAYARALVNGRRKRRGALIFLPFACLFR